MVVQVMLKCHINYLELTQEHQQLLLLFDYFTVKNWYTMQSPTPSQGFGRLIT